MLFKAEVSVAMLSLLIFISLYLLLLAVRRTFAFSSSAFVVESHSLRDHSVPSFFNFRPVHSNRSFFVFGNLRVMSRVRGLILSLGGA